MGSLQFCFPSNVQSFLGSVSPGLVLSRKQQLATSPAWKNGAINVWWLASCQHPDLGLSFDFDMTVVDSIPCGFPCAPSFQQILPSTCLSLSCKVATKRHSACATLQRDILEKWLNHPAKRLIYVGSTETNKRTQ